MEIAEEVWVGGVFSEGDHGFARVHGVCGEGKRRKLGVVGAGEGFERRMSIIAGYVNSHQFQKN